MKFSRVVFATGQINTSRFFSPSRSTGTPLSVIERRSRGPARWLRPRDLSMRFTLRREDGLFLAVVPALHTPTAFLHTGQSASSHLPSNDLKGSSSFPSTAESTTPPQHTTACDGRDTTTTTRLCPEGSSSTTKMTPPSSQTPNAPNHDSQQPQHQHPSRMSRIPSPPPAENYLLRLFSVWQQGVVASIGAVMGIAVLFYFLSAPMKEDTVHHTAAMASEALQDANLQERAIDLSKMVVQDVLNDPNSLNLTVKLVTQLLAREEVKVAISSLLLALFEDHYTQEITKKFVLLLLRDRWVSDQLDDLAKKQVIRLLQNEEVKDAFANYIVEAASTTLRKPEIHDHSASAIRSTVLQLMNPFKMWEFLIRDSGSVQAAVQASPSSPS